MAWHLDILDWLAHAALGGTLFLAGACLAVAVCRQPIRRIRLIELALFGCLVVPWASRLPGLPHWSTGWMEFERPSGEKAIQREPAAAPVAQPIDTPLALAPIPPDVIPPAAETSPKAEANPPSPASVPAPEPARNPDVSVSFVIVTLYGSIIAGLVAWFILGLASLVRLYRSTYPVGEAVTEMFRGIAGPAGASVRLVASDRIDLPLAFAGWRPIIVLPGSLCRANDPAALRYSLAHEWSHVQGGDVWRWYLAAVVQFVYFYNPLFWWLRRQLRLSQDYLADARAAEQTKLPEDYAEFLVGLCHRRQHAPAAALGIADRRSNLYRRIIMLLQTGKPLERRCFKAWSMAAFLAGLGLLVACSMVRLDAGDRPKDAKDPAAGKAAKEQPPKIEKGETLHYTGRVTDKDTGKPIVGATVTVRRSLYGDPEVKEENQIVQETKHKTDADGKYRFTIPPEQTSKRYLYIELDVEHPNYAPRKRFGYALSMIRKNEQLGGRPFFEQVRMRAGAPITGTVQTPEGKPVAGVRVQAYSVTNKVQGRFEYGSFADCRTDAKGQFRLVVTTPGSAVFWIFPEKFAPSVHRVKDDLRGDLGTFTLQKGITLRGKVLDVRGKPLAGINVNAEATRQSEELQGLNVAGQLNRSAVSNDKGEFTMAPLPAGEYRVLPGEHVRDGSKDYRKRYPVPGVFVGQKVTLKEGLENLEVRAVPHVVIEAQYLDSKGKPTRGHSSFIFGQFDKDFWHTQTKVDANGKMTANIPHGLENVRMDLMTNEHGVLRHRKTKGGPLQNSRQLDLKTVNDDVKGIEIIRYVAPILLVKVSAEDGGKLSKVGVSAIYPPGKAQFPGRLNLANGVQSDVSFEKQKDSRFRSSQLLPDEEVTITAQAEGYQNSSIKVRLPEETTKEVELVLAKAVAKPATKDQVKEALLNEALEAYRRVLAEEKRPREKAETQKKIGRILVQLGKFQEAEAVFRQVIAVHEKLAAEAPQASGHRQDLASSYHDLGKLFRSTGRLKEAETSLRKALELRLKLTDAPGSRGELARSYGEIAGLLRDTGRNKEAEEASRRAKELQK